MSNVTSAAASVASPVEASPRFDFPGWLPPMLVKELRQGLRQRGFVGGLIAAQAVLAIMFIWGFVVEVDAGGSRGMIDGVFWSTVFATLLLVAPLRALGALHAEIDARTMDLLLLTRLDSWRIVWGKWVSLVTQSLLLIVSIFPYAVVRYFFGAVDVVQDFVVIGIMLVLSAVFTAAGLWASGMNRVLRMFLVIGVIFMSFGTFGNMLAFGRMSGHAFGFTGRSSSPMEWVFAVVWVWVAACAVAYCLMLAVRWFAPAAENHAIGPRLLPLALAMPLPIVAWVGTGNELQEYAAVWLAACAFIALIEMAGAREVMAIHLRGRLGRPGWRRVGGALLLPGWQSAALWAAVVLVLSVTVMVVADWFSAGDSKAGLLILLAALAWAGLVVPALVVSSLRSLGRVTGLMYFIAHALFGALAGMAGSTALSKKAPAFIHALEWVSQAVPPMSFWQAISNWNKLGTPQFGWSGPVAGVVLTVALVWWMARPYWTGVRQMREAANRSGTRE